MHDTGSFFGSGRSRSSGSAISRASSVDSRRSLSSSSSSHLSDETPVRRRDTVTITTAEIGKVFDAFNSVSAQLKLQGQVLENVKTSLEDLSAELQELKEDRRVLMEKIENSQQENAADDGKIPPEISSDVHLLHNSLSLDRQYKPEQSVLSLHNASVRRELEEQMMNEDKGYPLRLIKRAVVRYYETKRKIYLQKLPENRDKADRQKEENKLRSRRKRLFSARVKACNDDEKENLQRLTYDYVSDEEDGNGPNRGSWVVRRPVWRSERVNNLMKRLQGRINNCQHEDLRPRVPRVEGPPSERQVPRRRVDWALLANPLPATEAHVHRTEDPAHRTEDPVRVTDEHESAEEEEDEEPRRNQPPMVTPTQDRDIPRRESQTQQKRRKHNSKTTNSRKAPRRIVECEDD
ncbi:hypothetical protein ACROYT_G020699 [Oculina patagonica]